MVRRISTTALKANTGLGTLRSLFFLFRRKLRVLVNSLWLLSQKFTINFLLKIGNQNKPKTLNESRARSLHGKYKRRDIYAYDTDSKKCRAQSRFKEISSLVDLSKVQRIVEVGAGDGQLALLFSQYGLEVDIIDAEDWRDDEVKQSNIKFNLIGRHNQFDMKDRSVDFIYSYGTFEHVANPKLALEEMLRVTRPEGHIFLYFGPLYNSPWGLHAYRTFYGPYPQFLLSQELLKKFAVENGIWDLGQKRTDFQYVNGWSLSRYMDLFSTREMKFTIEQFKIFPNYDGLGVIRRHWQNFAGRNLSFRELTSEGIKVLLRVHYS